MAKPPIITLLTDFGLSDHYVAAMKGVILGICRKAILVDISHEISAFDVPGAAFTLAQAYTCFPKGTIHLVVVDPGVGSERRPLLVEAVGHLFIAPDNGVLSFPLASDKRWKARSISAERYFREPLSRTFHGRDLFAPVAAHLATGVPAARFGKRIPDPVRLDLATPSLDAEGCWTGKVLRIDHFGNIVTNFDWETFSKLESTPFQMSIAGTTLRQYCRSYSDAPPTTLVVLRGSSGYYEISINQGDAAFQLSSYSEAPIHLSFEP